ncbi:MAG: DUF2182 domain-containing protein [Pseudomonadota bacterium]
MVAQVVRAMTTQHWLSFFALVLLSWGILFATAVPADLRMAGRVYGSDVLIAMCMVTPDAAGFVRVAGMWLVMSIAMMAPTALPAFATYEDLGQSAPTQFWRLVAGFVLAWGGFALVASGAQIALLQVGLLSPFGELRSTGISALVLVGAGAYQFSSAKSACLAKCRSPMSFFLAHWSEGAFRNGIRLGLVCIGCCWALMALALVGGAMSVAFMGLATLIMVTEKLPDLGQYVTRPLGGALIAAGLVMGALWTGALGG